MPRRILSGVVVSNKCDKTITVNVSRRFMHPLYKKYITRTKKYAVHDPASTGQIGDTVRFIECKPISKMKRWVLLEESK